MDHDATDGGQRHEFPTTHWSDLMYLHDTDHPRYRAMLDRLIAQYWKPSYHYIRALRHASADDAQDLTQQFFAMILSNGRLERLAPERGTFRGFLKTSLKNFLVSTDRARQARLPQDGAKLFRFGEVEQEWLAATEGLTSVTPEEAFDQEWAREMMMDAVTLLDQVLAQDDKATYFDMFCDYYLEPYGVLYRTSSRPAGTREPGEQPSYGELARRYHLSEDDVGNYLRIARQKIREILTDLLKEAVGPGGCVEDELRFVFSR